jgi:predicted amidohydrolase/bacterioferritin (cytochrome b1)
MTTLDEVWSAYMRLKTHVYYDSKDLFIRNQITRFETNTILGTSLSSVLSNYYDNSGKVRFFAKMPKPDEKLEIIAKCIDLEDDSFFEKIFDHITWRVLPKSVKKNEGSGNGQSIITNNRSQSSYSLDKVFVQIDVPTEIQIICVLWLIKYGADIEKGLSINAVANRLILNQEKNSLIQGASLFYPYYKGYQKWKYEAIEEAKRLLEKNQDIIFINIDIANYYYSVRLDFDKLRRELNIPEECFITRLFEKILKICCAKLRESGLPLFENTSADDLFLPIGLVSSSVLANWYLKPIDEKIEYGVRPVHYGRYVDDILMVFKAKNSNEGKTVQNIYEEYLGLLTQADGQGTEIFSLISLPDCKVNSAKTLVYEFKHSESHVLLTKLKNEIDVRASVENEINLFESENDFESMAFIYSSDASRHKFSSIRDFKENKHGMSTYLSSQIIAAIYKGRSVSEIELNRITKYFRGSTLIENFSLWEKVYTFLVVNRSKRTLIEFIKRIEETISRITIASFEGLGKINTNHSGIHESLQLYNQMAFELAVSLNSDFIESDDTEFKAYEMLKKQNLRTVKFSNKEMYDLWGHHKRRFRDSNLLRHNYLLDPLVTFWDYEDIPRDLLSLSRRKPLKGKAKALNVSKVSLNPRSVKIWECCFFEIKTHFMEGGGSADAFLSSALSLYDSLNKSRFPTSYDSSKIFSVKSKSGESSLVSECHVHPINLFDLSKFRIGIANMELDPANYEAALMENPKYSYDRYQQIVHILNSASRNKVNMLVFPECSVPYAYIPLLSRWSSQSQIAVVFGTEPLIQEKVAYNFIMTLLPFDYEGVKDSILLPRIKNCYSHEEKKAITGHHLRSGEPQMSEYHIVEWGGLYFSPYCCFELSHPEHRSLTRSKVDLIVVSEWNHDVNYFSNIIESLSRDNHVFIAQSNDSNCGDSRLVAPRKTELRDIVRIKGGRNTEIIVGEIDVVSLRNFQLRDYSITQAEAQFKPLPPGFSSVDTKTRIARGFFNKNVKK